MTQLTAQLPTENRRCGIVGVLHADRQRHTRRGVGVLLGRCIKHYGAGEAFMPLLEVLDRPTSPGFSPPGELQWVEDGARLQKVPRDDQSIG